MRILDLLYDRVLHRLVDQVPDMRYFDWFADQIEETEKQPFPIPAVLYEQMPVSWQSIGRKRQQAEVQFTLYIVTDSEWDRNNLTEDNIRELAYDGRDIVDEVHRALLGFNSNQEIGSITRNSDIADAVPQGQNVHILGFKTRLVDDSGKNFTQINKADIKHVFTGKWVKKEIVP